MQQVFCYERDYSQLQAAEMLRETGWPNDQHVESMLVEQRAADRFDLSINCIDDDDFDDEGVFDDDDLPDVDDRTYDD